MHTGSTSVLEFASRRRPRRPAAIVRVGLAVAIACAPVTAALAQGTQAPQKQNNQQGRTEAQRQATPGRLTIPVAATVETPSATESRPDVDAAPAPPVTGSFSIQRFAPTTEDAVAAVGTLTLSLSTAEQDAPRTIVTQVAMTVARSGDTTTGPQASAAATTQACQTLNLVLGPLDLPLLGLTVHLGQSNVALTVVPGAGERLGSLLCEVSEQIDGAARPADVVSTLNTLLDMIG